MLLLNSIIGVLAGLAGHQAERVIRLWEDGGTPKVWTRLARYNVSVLILSFVYVMMRHDNDHDIEAIESDVTKFLVAAMTIAAGKVIGYFLDTNG